MKVGILGTGMVATTISTILVNNGHEVMIGSRNKNTERATQWAEKHKNNAYHGNFRMAAKFGEILWNCTAGTYSLNAIVDAGVENFQHKILIDVANPLDFSKGFPPALTICNTTSLSEEIQLLLPEAKVVKAMNTLSLETIANAIKGNANHHVIFLCGDDDFSKEEVTKLLKKDFNWRMENIINLGGIVHSRSTEMLLPFLSSLALKTGNSSNALKITYE